MQVGTTGHSSIIMGSRRLRRLLWCAPLWRHAGQASIGAWQSLLIVSEYILKAPQT